ncbi:Signal transduction histidine kinase [Ignavibacterium album JCM 16511]|uniref:Signal transduction histidine kinase n=1 Tax=Ignavibacterium album (strain DSM 19864 / JCM 16511 / NBRC 101810 / Mat9-16) TaxID=945713 RepID=I0APG7_IGNAJ|nr:sensor histidine kinase [Ignavibacterium album]AFH50874.1 Signal transduction histidine kinase [Ignavibacterium album JCM 16511]
MQSQNIQDVGVKEMFRESINRIRSMAIIHEYLYRSDNQSEIDLSLYIESLADNLLSVYADTKKELIINYSMDNVFTDFDIAIPVGLIVNEIVTNSIKHGFLERPKGKIDIFLEKNKSKIKLTIRDNGVGIPVNLDVDYSKTLGLQLIKLLVTQLNGEYKIYREDGTTVQIEIPFKELKPD